MPANTAPLFPLTPRVEYASLTAANTSTNGTGTTAALFTAGTNGSRADRIKAVPLGTNVASVARIFINNGSTPATASNNSLYAEMALPATTATNAAEIGQKLEKALNIALPTGYKFLLCLGTAVAAGWAFHIVGGDY